MVSGAVLFAICLLAMVPLAMSCSCRVPPSLEERVCNAEYVALIKVIKEVKNPKIESTLTTLPPFHLQMYDRYYKVKVDEVYKPLNQDKTTMPTFVRTPRGSSMCGVILKQGFTYLSFGSLSKDQHFDQVMPANSCTSPISFDEIENKQQFLETMNAETCAKYVKCPYNQPRNDHCDNDPCDNLYCKETPEASCQPYRCGSCANTRWFVAGYEVKCTPKRKCETGFPAPSIRCEGGSSQEKCPSGYTCNEDIGQCCEVRKCAALPFVSCNKRGSASNSSNAVPVPVGDTCPQGYYCNEDTGECCQEPCDIPPTPCFADPCSVTQCPNFPTAHCRSETCGGCRAMFLTKYHGDVTSMCKEPICDDGSIPLSFSCDKTCPEDYSCREAGGKRFCCRETCKAPVACPKINLCAVTECPSFPDATCRLDYCKSCGVRFFTEDEEVTAKCTKPEPTCDIDTPLPMFCGRGPNHVNCPSGYSCKTDPADRFAVCCKDPCKGTAAKCIRNPCLQRKKCRNFPIAECRADYCCGCSDARFFIQQGEVTDKCDGDPRCPPVPKEAKGTCRHECSESEPCSKGQVCCSNGCGMVCKRVEDRRCPKLKGNHVGICVEACNPNSRNSGCPKDTICCSNGCGHTCMPLSGPVPEPGPLPPVQEQP